MNTPDLTQAIKSTDQLLEVRDTLRQLHGTGEYERRIGKYQDVVGQNMDISGASALETAIAIAKDAVAAGMPWTANWVLAAAVELETGP